VSNEDVKQDALDNLADALTEDILNTPDDELLREVEEDYGDPRALANKFDQILERAEKQVFGTTRSAASPQVRSSVLGLPISLPDETIRWVKGIFDLGIRLSEFLSSLTPRTLAWSATAAIAAILVPAAVIIAVLVKEGAPSSQTVATTGIPDVPPRASLGEKADQLPETPVGSKGDWAGVKGTAWPAGEPDASPQPDRKTIADLLKREQELQAGRKTIEDALERAKELIAARKISEARQALKIAADAGSAPAALWLGMTYDPTILQEHRAPTVQKQMAPTASVMYATPPVVSAPPPPVGSAPTPPVGSAATPPVGSAATDPVTDIAMARAWYEKARELGSTEAAERLRRLTSVPR
jgi:hypothetical protein